MAAHRRVQDRHAGDGERGATLWVELEADVAPAHDCPLSDVSDPEAEGSVQLVGERCHLTLARGTESAERGIRTYTTDVREGCLCPSFSREGCVPEVLAVENGSLTVGAYADSRATLASVMESVRDRAANVRLRRLTTADASAEPRGWRSEAGDEVTLTDKQREAVQTAVEMGYYESPRTASLGDLADRLGVTRSALSQRLNAVETKLITALVSRL